MSRIRSIKPEFWRSDDINRLPRELRLLFIGLWSYVDDNGVGIDDYRLIVGDLFPLEEDVAEVRTYVREGLARLSRESLIARYTFAGKSYLFIRTWDSHQRVDKPGKARYPRPEPDPDPVTSGNGDRSESSRDSRETLALGEGEQGRRGEGEKGSRGRPPRSSSSLAALAPTETSSARAIEPAATLAPSKAEMIRSWIDAYTANTDCKPTDPVKNQAGKEIGDLIKAGNDPILILEAAKQAGAKGYATVAREIGPMNGRVVHRQYRKPTPTENRDRIAAELDAEMGWPPMRVVNGDG